MNEIIKKSCPISYLCGANDAEMSFDLSSATRVKYS